ncbi:MAG: FlgD immunoglobulin-like domain containing protein [candidate division WOR-3 bacterium]
MERVLPVCCHPDDRGAVVDPGVMVFSPDGNKLYCGGGLGWSIVVDCATNRIIKNLPTAFSSGNALWVNNKVYLSTIKGTTIIDGVADTIITTLPVGVVGDEYGFVYNDSNNCLLTLVDADSGALAVVDGTTNTIRAILRTSSRPLAAFWNPHSNRYHVLNGANRGHYFLCHMTVFDGRYNRVIDSFPLEVTSHVAAAYVPSNNHLYVQFDTTLLVIDGATNQIVKHLPIAIENLGLTPRFFWNPVFNRLYRFPVLPPGDSGFILVIDCTGDSVVKGIPIAGPFYWGRRPAFIPALNRLFFSYTDGIGILDCNADTLFARSIPMNGWISDLVWNEPRNRLYAALHSCNQIRLLDVESLQVVDTIFTGISTIGAVLRNPFVNKLYVRSVEDNRVISVSVLDCETGRLIRRIRTGLGGYEEQRLSLHPSGRKLYCPNQESNTIAVIDCLLDTVVKTIPVSSGPYDLTLNTTNHKLYCTHFYNPLLTVIDYDADTVLATVHVPVVNGSPWVTWHAGVNKAYIEGVTRLAVVDGVTNRLVATIPHLRNDLIQPPGACNLRDAKLYFTVSPGMGPIMNGVFYSVDALADTILDSFPVLPVGSTYGVVWNRAADKAYFYAVAWDKFVGVVDGVTDSLVDSILLPSHANQLTGPISHPQESYVYWCLEGNDSLNGGVLVIDCDRDTIVTLVPFPVAVEAMEIYGMSFDSAEDRVYVASPTSHIYVINGQLGGIQNYPAAGYGLKREIECTPNPFRTIAEIRYHLRFAAETELRVYSSNGRLVRTLVQCRQNPGNYSIVWDGKDNSGNGLSPGIYFIHLKSPNCRETRKVILAK